ncbi:MAG: hypothetical protein LBH90_01910 [Tannerella sp.]|jgi:hypothetical protein|nr:hypothetical protein [Tannerella sp.]
MNRLNGDLSDLFDRYAPPNCLSMMCIAPGFDLWAQETGSAAGAAHELKPWRDTDTGKWGLKKKTTQEITVPVQYDEIDKDT